MHNSLIRPDDFILAPMAEITHAAFRRLCHEFGGFDWYFTEMLSAPGLVSTSLYTPWYFDFGPAPERTFVQLAGSDPETFYRAAERVIASEQDGRRIAGIDINMGCSVHHIRKRGWGVELMNKPGAAVEIVRALVPLMDGRSLSVKLRIGKAEHPKALLGLCASLIEAGVDFLTLNPRTSRSNRNRPGDWSYVKLLREELPVPVIGNGEITGSESFEARRRTAGPGPVMIGRAAVQKPWIAAELAASGARANANANANTLEPTAPLFAGGRVDLQATAERFIELLELHQPQDFHVSRARRFFFYFCDNYKFGYQVKMNIQHALDLEAIRELALGYLQRNPSERYRPSTIQIITKLTGT